MSSKKIAAIMNCLDMGLVLKLRQLCGGAIVRAIV